MQSLSISTAALRSIQAALDTTANNLSNLDTVGYKRRGATFSELLVDSLNNQPDADQERTSPAGLRVGSGVRVGLTALDMSQGAAKSTDVPSDLMIEGDGFFLVSRRVRDRQGNLLPEEFRLTRNGAFHLSNSEADPDNFYNLVTSTGDVLVDERGIAIEIPKNGSFKVEPNGRISINGSDSGLAIPVWKLPNPDQYQQAGDNEWVIDIGQGVQPGDVLPRSDARLRQGALEMSNVDMRQEMTQLILAQRAYQLNARAIGISDQMMGIANSLRAR